jgi:hypothetical protein
VTVVMLPSLLKVYTIENSSPLLSVAITSSSPFLNVKIQPMSDVDRRAWLVKTLNAFANTLRPRLRKWYEEMGA